MRRYAYSIGCILIVFVAEQVKFPRYNEIVTINMPDGTERNGQVLEARGRFPMFRGRYKLLSAWSDLISYNRNSSCCAGTDKRPTWFSLQVQGINNNLVFRCSKELLVST